MTHARQALGARGEEAVAAWYQDRGYQVLARNWRCRDGEIDLIARRGATVVFCEVKTRSSSAFGGAAEAVTRSKQARLRRLAAQWLASEAGARAPEVRFDVASVERGTIEVIQAAF